MAVEPHSLPPVREAVEEDNAASERNREVQAINSPALQPPERVWKKGEPELQVIRRRPKIRNIRTRKRRFRILMARG